MESDQGFDPPSGVKHGGPSVSLNLPVYENKSSFTAWTMKFHGYCALVGLNDEQKLQVLPLCFPSKKFDSVWESLDRRSTVNSALDKLELCIRQEERPADPLKYFTDRSWHQEETVYDFVRELRRRAAFLTRQKSAVEDLVRLQIVRSLPLSVQSIASSVTDTDDLVKMLATLPRETTATVAFTRTDPPIRLVCWNCDKPGHSMGRCVMKKASCSTCNQSGHLAKYCGKTTKRANSSKNVFSGSSQ